MDATEALRMTKSLHAQLEVRRRDIDTAHRYYRGDQDLRFASEKWREYHAARYEKFSDNWCGVVANSPNERQRIDGFRLDDDPAISSTEKTLWSYWQANDMEAQSSQGILESIITGRSFVLVWGDSDDQPVATWERPDQVIVQYDPENPRKRLAALKCWHEDDEEYATLYTPAAVWKWRRPYNRPAAESSPIAVPPGAARAAGFFSRTTPAGLYVPESTEGWQPRQVDDSWPLTNPMGEVPVVEYANRPMLGAEPISDITGTMAMQDAVNLLWAYLFNAADHASFPARVVMGQEPPKLPILNEAGVKVGEKAVDLKKLSEDRILWLTGQQTKVGQWDAAKLDVFTTVIEIAVTHIAAQTRTPPHYLVLGKGLVNVNAEGMKTAETGLVMKVREQRTYFGPSGRDTFRLMALAAGDTKAAEACRQGVVQWKDAENHSEAQLADSLVKLGTIGFPFEWLAERYGLSQTEVTRVLAMKERAAQMDPVSQMAAAINPPAPVGG